MKLNAVNLRTARLPEMVSFYRDLLGLPCQERVPGRWEIQVGDLCLALVQGENVPPPDPENCLLEFAVEDALAQYRRVTGLGLSPPGRARRPALGLPLFRHQRPGRQLYRLRPEALTPKKREEAPPPFFYFPPPLFSSSML